MGSRATPAQRSEAARLARGYFNFIFYTYAEQLAETWAAQLAAGDSRNFSAFTGISTITLVDFAGTMDALRYWPERGWEPPPLNNADVPWAVPVVTGADYEQELIWARHVRFLFENAVPVLRDQAVEQGPTSYDGGQTHDHSAYDLWQFMLPMQFDEGRAREQEALGRGPWWSMAS